MILFTVGYEGFEVGEFLALMRREQVQTLIDIREIPISHKPGFSKTALSNGAKGRGIDYVHIAALGCPKEIRHNYRDDKDWIRYTRRFLEYIQTQNDALAEGVSLVRKGNSCLVCFEADYHYCHRRFVAQRLGDLIGEELQIRHLGLLETKVVPLPEAWVGISIQR